MVSERVKEKQKLQHDIFEIISKHVGFKTYLTHQEADASFWKRPQTFLKELTTIEDLDDLVIEKVKDYPIEKGVGQRDLKEWKVKIAKKSNPQVRCNLKMTVFGQDEFGGTNKTELSISGDCFIDLKKKEYWWEEE